MVEKKPTNINRRDFLKLSGGVGAASIFLLAGCDREPEKYGRDFPELEHIYPEVKDKKVFEVGYFDTPGTTRKYYNFTDSKFDPEVAKSYARDMETMADAQLHFQFRLDSDEVTRDVTFVPTNIEYQYLFIIPKEENFPYFFTHKFSVDEPTAATSLPNELNNKVAITVIKLEEDVDRLNLFNNLKEDVNAYLSVELCQASMEAQVNESFDHAMQEIGCNSLGNMYSSKQMGGDYQSYRSFIDSVGTISLIPFDKQIYEQLPSRGMPINP